MRICIEASGLSPWVGRILTELGHEVIVANAQRVRLIAESTLKNDRVDAETLARLVRMDPALLCPIRHRSEETQRLRGMLRVRRTLINSRTACLIPIHRPLWRNWCHREEFRRRRDGARPEEARSDRACRERAHSARVAVGEAISSPTRCPPSLPGHGTASSLRSSQ